MSRFPVLIICIALILGILFQEYGNFENAWSISIILLGFIIPFINLKHLKTIGFFILFFGIGSFLHYLNKNISPKIEWNKNENITFTLQKKLNSNERNRRYEILILPQNVKAVASIPRTLPELNFAQFYNADAFINKIAPPQHKYQFDYQNYMSRKNIFYQAYISSEILSTEKQQLSLSEQIQQHRLTVLQNINNSEYITLKNKEFLKGIILADRTEIDPETISAFTQTGLIHILAISGAHIALIFISLNFILGRIFQKKWSVILCLVFIWAFVIFIGFGNSVVRAATMLSIHHIYTILQRRPNAFHTLSLSATIILIFNTYELFDIGFQLSFVAVFGIFWLNNPLLSLLPKKNNKIYNYFITLLATTISTQITTIPIILLYFNQFTVLSIITNLVILWIAQVIIILSFFITLLFSINLNFKHIEVLYNHTCSFFLSSVKYFSKFDNFLLQNIPMSISESIILFLIILKLRFLILKPTLKNNLQISFLIISFLCLKTLLDHHAYQKQEILRHNFQGKIILSIKYNDNIDFYIPANANEQKVMKYIINPYMNNCRVSKFKLFHIPKNTKSLKINNLKYELE